MHVGISWQEYVTREVRQVAPDLRTFGFEVNRCDELHAAIEVNLEFSAAEMFFNIAHRIFNQRAHFVRMIEGKRFESDSVADRFLNQESRGGCRKKHLERTPQVVNRRFRISEPLFEVVFDVLGEEIKYPFHRRDSNNWCAADALIEFRLGP